jgi:5-methylcytosine-specific restriction endonuclease McrBC regulatory subunit McrC
MNQLFEQFIAAFIRHALREVWQSRGWTFHARSSLATGILQMAKNQGVLPKTICL